MAVPKSHRGFVERATHQSTSLPRSASHAALSGQDKPLPLPWKSQISVIAKDNKSIGSSRQNLDSSPRHFAKPKSLSALGFTQYLPQKKLLGAEEDANKEILAIWLL